MHTLPNSLHKEPLQVLSCTYALALVSREICNTADVLDNAAGCSGKLLASGSSPAKSVAVILLLHGHRVRCKAFFWGLRVRNGLSEVARLLHLNCSHHLQRGSTPTAFRPKDGKALGVIRIHMGRRILWIHLEEEKHCAPLVFNQSQKRPLSASDEAHRVRGHRKNSKIIMGLGVVDLDWSKPLRHHKLHILLGILALLWSASNLECASGVPVSALLYHVDLRSAHST
mmetsp:Transcript_6277/g.10067  ORF Transcript_6277/g.10067 Transcript_6277/m.10067 type:complete len:228 (+) Transcript_6277:963-1646(+)